MFYIDRFPTLVPPMIVFLLAFFVSVHLTWVLQGLSRRLGILDHPDERKPQPAPVPCTGGVAVVTSVTVSLLLSYGRSPQVQVILWVGLGIAAVGLLDDVFSVRAAVKLLALAVGCLVLSRHGIGLNRTPWAALNWALTFLWVAGVASAFNAIDNADGLAGSICLISAAAIFFLGWSTWQMAFSFLAMALAGAALGFLHHNVKPARIYLGDCGSFFLGYVLAVLVIFGDWSENPLQSFLGGCFVVGLPIYDLALTTLLRVRHGIVKSLADAIAYSDRDHLSHRLLRMGLSHGQMLAALCALSAAGGAVGLLIVRSPPAGAAALAVVSALALAALGLYLDGRTSCPALWLNPAPGPGP